MFAGFLSNRSLAHKQFGNFEVDFFKSISITLFGLGE